MYRYPEFPDHVYVELTNICNARCTICATPAMKRPRKIMTQELFAKLARECGQRGARKLLPFLHGESLLVPGVLDYFREARRLAPETHINLTTNGSRLDEEIGDALLRERLVDSVIVSIDGGDRETYEGIRIGLNYDEVRDNVLRFIRRRDELGMSRPHVAIAMVTVDENRHTRERLRETWKEADEVRFSVYFNWAGRLTNRGRPPHKVNFCERLYHYITILADGRVAMCCFDSEAEHAVGDVNQADDSRSLALTGLRRKATSALRETIRPSRYLRPVRLCEPSRLDHSVFALEAGARREPSRRNPHCGKSL